MLMLVAERSYLVIYSVAVVVQVEHVVNSIHCKTNDYGLLFTPNACPTPQLKFFNASEPFYLQHHKTNIKQHNFIHLLICDPCFNNRMYTMPSLPPYHPRQKFVPSHLYFLLKSQHTLPHTITTPSSFARAMLHYISSSNSLHICVLLRSLSGLRGVFTLIT